MNRQELELLKKIMALEFIVLEFSLYLNTHPCDEDALEDQQYYACKLKDLKRTYHQEYGPLTARCCNKEYPWYSNCSEQQGRYLWTYIDSPWPWQINY
ncbi:MAG: spore coat protein CotJB [Bacillota bacterium]